MAANPYAFSARSMTDKPAMILFISVFSTSFVLPAFGTALMKPLGLIRSLQMDDKLERTGPYIVSGIFYLWLYKNLDATGQAPALFNTFVLGATIALFFAFFINIFTKISAHAVGMGGLAAMTLLTNTAWDSASIGIPVLGGTLQLSMIAVLALVVLLAGFVGSARLALGAHIPADLYRGYAAGMSAVFLANFTGL